MAAETIALEYLFLPDADTSEVPMEFIHFALHDVESVWWTGIWMVFFNHTPDHKEEAAQRTRRQQMTVSVFPGTTDHRPRRALLNGTDYRNTMREWPSPAFKAFILLLRDYLQLLVEAYTVTEATFPQGISGLLEKVRPGDTPRPAFPGAGEGVKIHSQLMTSIREKVDDYKRITFEPITDVTTHV